LAIVVVPAMAPDSHQAFVEVGPGRQVLLSLDTPAPDGSAPLASGPPAPGSHWALVTLPASKDPGASGGSLPESAAQAIVDHLRGTGAAPGAAVAGSGPPAPVAAVAGVADVHSDDAARAARTPDTGLADATQPVSGSPETNPPGTEAPHTGSPDPGPPGTGSGSQATTPPTTGAAPAPAPTTSVFFTGTATPPETVTIGPSTAPTTAVVTVVTVDSSSPAGSDAGGSPSDAPPPSSAANGPDVGARDVRFWPFASNSVWNTPRGAGATFDSREIVANGEINASNGFGVSVGNAGYPLADQIDTNRYAESHYSFIDSDGMTATEWYQYQNPGNVNRNNSITDLRGSGIVTGIDPGPVGSANQQRASKVSQLGGLIRVYDLDQGAIRHALSVALPNSALKPGWVWPAAGQDGDAATAYQGFVPMGSFLAIPSDAPMPAGMSAAGQMIWTALRDYGAYVVDRGATAPIVAEAAAQAAVAPARADLASIWPQVRVVTNAARDAVGGPGARLAPPAPPVP
jgi:hypothetical protein